MDTSQWFEGFVAGMKEGGGEPPSVPRYQSLEKVGEGGQAEVYRAWDGELKRRVALKVLHESPLVSEDARRRFEREARLMAGLSHPNVVAVYDVTTSGERLCLVMELIEGPPLDRVLAERKLGMRELVGILHQACLGVAAAHEKGIVHRDLKPGNILLTPEGKAKVGDFGLAHVADGATKLTATGAPMGTPAYMAPEQVEGTSRSISARTDVYALGGILYEMATGRPPHAGRTAAELYAKILGAEPASPRSRNPKVPRDLETVIVKALEKEPKRRYADARELAEDLGRWLEGEAIQARPATWGYRARKFVRRRKAVVGVAVAGVALTAGLAAYLVPKWRGERKAKVALELERIEREKKREARERAQPYRTAGDRLVEEMRLLLPNGDAGLSAVAPVMVRAEAEYQRAIALDPDYAEAYVGLARAYRVAGVRDHALETLDQAIRVDPRCATAYLDRIRLRIEPYAVEGAHEEASPALNRSKESLLSDLAVVERYARDTTERLYAEALLAYAERDLARTEAALRNYLRSVPGDTDAYYWMGQTLYQLDRSEEAEIALTRLLRLDACHPTPYVLRGLIREDRHDFDGALEDCSRAIVLDPNYAEGYLWRSVVRMDRGEFDLAIKDAECAIRLEPTNPYAYRDRGKAHAEQGDHEAAIADFSKAVELDPRYALAYCDRGNSHHARGEYEAAIGDFGAVLNLDPRNARAFLNRGAARSALGASEAAIADFDRAIEVDPRYVRAYYNRGVEWRKRERDDLALSDFSKCIEVDPNYADAYLARAVLRGSQGNRSRAVADLSDAVRLSKAGTKTRTDAEELLKLLKR